RQVTHPTALVDAEELQQQQGGTESNVMPFVLRPRVTDVSVADITETDDECRNATITVEVNVVLEPSQRVVLAMNEFSLASPTAYMFDAPKRSADANQVTIPIRDVAAADYLVRLLIDGAESQLSIDTDQESATYDWYIGPRVRIV
ncbi:MAG: DUF4255 domain-containing protein, partial [Leptolyngbya sp. SIO1D8]|nr:DUF4255 domain-containing protein [Leptolyngbya sp. SIO1D8]